MLKDWKEWHKSNESAKRAKRFALLLPPPWERSHDPIIVLATIKGMLSASAQPQLSTAIAIWARGRESSRAFISEPKLK